MVSSDNYYKLHIEKRVHDVLLVTLFDFIHFVQIIHGSY